MRGDILIKIICEPCDKFKQIGNSDLFMMIDIQKKSYLEQKNKKYNMVHIDGSEFNFVLDCKNDELPIYCIKNKGLPKNIKNEETSYGNFYVYFKFY